MKKIFLLSLVLSISFLTFGQDYKQKIISTDIENFWNAFEKINSITDSALQRKYLKELYIDKGTQGLKYLIEVRDYTENDFISNMTKYPNFWKSLKTNTLDSKNSYTEIETSIQKLKLIYPDLKYYPIYFAIGAFRTPGTTFNNTVLIGSELSQGDETTIVDEFSDWRKSYYKEYNPRKNLPLLCTHEYVHTQQKELVYNLLSKCLYEGIAEFVSCKATKNRSNSPAIEFGKANPKIVLDKYISDMFTMNNDGNWMWSENKNEFKVRDLGYYIGYEIAERYYNLSNDKTKSIKELIELDFKNEKEVTRIVESTKLFPKSLDNLYKDYENKRPTVLSIMPFKNKSKTVKPGVIKITIIFSEPTNKYNKGLDYGPMGETALPKIIHQSMTFSQDGRSWSFETELQPNQHYQILIPNTFRLKNGIRLKPYLIDFNTTE